MRFATDENFHGDILSGLQKRLTTFDVVRVQDTDMYQASDPDLLEWLAKEDRILLTHDVQTMPGFAYARIKKGDYVPGVIVIHQSIVIQIALDELEVIIGAGEPEDFLNQVKYIPLQ